ncbi:MAG TPA: ANTAR domain-containing protein [Actinomycetota bacterium]|nr:ANTAR domain-containing protein [Actinomycetota bacterium]
MNSVADPADALEKLATHAVSEETVGAEIRLIVELAGPPVGAQAVSISLVDKNGKVGTVFSSNAATADAVDGVQYEMGTGPCLQAIRDGETQVVSSMLKESRWPEITNRALYAGVQSVIAYPLKSKDGCFGALNFYSSKEEAFADDAIALGSRFAARAAARLLDATRYEAASELASQLRQALESRAEIDQAKGILMERHKISADEAFERLKLISQRSSIKVRDVARMIVAEGVEPGIKP